MVLDNTESILGLPETSTQEIHAIVDELSRLSNICLVFTSRVSNSLPTHCEIIEIPTLSMEAGHETFYRIYRFGERSDPINEILRELDFHPLSITLFATVAQQNRWDTRQLTMEWESHRTRVLRTRNLGSLAATVELSLASSMFQELGPDARDVLEVVAFFPQGLKEVKDDNVDGPTVFDIFCNLSLTHRCNGFITMLAPLRDYLRPRDPMASPFLRTCKEFYFKRLSVDLGPGKPGFHESQWITSEDVNVEHLLDVFTSIDPDSDEVWYACYLFMDHLYWHKPRLVILRSKVEALPDSYLFKLNSLVLLSRLFDRVGNRAEQKRMLTHSLGIWREKGDDIGVVETLAHLSIANAAMGLYKEGIQRAREALEILGRLGETEGQVLCLIKLASFLRQDEQFDAAVEAASRAMVLSENGDQLHLCKCHDALTAIYQSTGNMKKVIYHYEASLRIASLISPRNPLLKGHFALARLYFEEGQLDEARGRLEFVKSRAGNSTLSLGRAFLLNAHILHRQRGFEEAKSDASCAADIFEKLGIMDYAEQTREVVGWIEKRRIEELGNDGSLLQLCTMSCSLTPRIQTWISPNEPKDYLSSVDPPASQQNFTQGCYYSVPLLPIAIISPLPATRCSGFVVSPLIHNLRTVSCLPVGCVASVLHMYIS